ncbi:MAG TPA: iron ABC transporter permease [Acidimicrobiia bacterium]|nr:iron ABC transporter permease [Acidimicrobiia bacterium]
MTAGPVVATPEARGAARRSLRSGWGWWLAALAILIPTLIPPLTLLGQVIGRGAGSAVSVGRLVELLVATLALTAAVTVTALAIGTATAWLTTRTDLPGRRFWLVAAALPLVIPSYMAALTVVGATGPGGWIASWLGWEVPTPYGFVGAWLALSVFLAPMAHLIVTPGLRSIDPATEEAATGLGAGSLKVFFTVTMPQLRPALVSAGLMVGLYTVSDFGAVSLLRFDTFTRAIYALYAGQIDRRPAAALSVVLMVLALAILMVERRTRTRAGYLSSPTRRARRPIALGRGQRLAAQGSLAAYGLVALVIPVATLVYWLVRGVGTGNEVGVLWDEVARSLTVAVAAAFLAVMAAYPIAMVTTWRRRRLSDAVETSVWGVYSLPHIAVGVAVIAFALQSARFMYQTFILLLVVYVGMFLAQATSSIQDSLRRSSPDLEDASRGLGRSALYTLGRVTIPITRSGILAGSALVFISVIKELPATLLLRPTGFETLAIRIWSSTGEGFYTRASAASLALLAVSIVPLLLLTHRDLST